MARQAETLKQLMHPRHWPAWLGIGLMWLGAQCPHPLRMALGRGVGNLAYRLAPSRRRIAQTNIGLCFPELSASEQQALVRRTFHSNGIGLIETAFAWFGDVEQLRDRVSLEGREHVEQALAGGRGVILLGGHFTTLDLGGALLSLFLEVDVTYREQSNRVFNYFMLRARDRLYGNAFDRSEIRSMLRSLKRNRPVWYAPDQDYGRRHSVFAPFFGVPAASITATARFAEMSGAPVVPISHFRSDDDRRYLVRFHPPLAGFPDADPVQSATLVNRWLEEAIREFPDQYMWLHRRFKTRPEGEPGFYKKKKKRKR